MCGKVGVASGRVDKEVRVGGCLGGDVVASVVGKLICVLIASDSNVCAYFLKGSAAGAGGRGSEDRDDNGEVGTVARSPGKVERAGKEVQGSETIGKDVEVVARRDMRTGDGLVDSQELTLDDVLSLRRTIVKESKRLVRMRGERGETARAGTELWGASEGGERRRDNRRSEAEACSRGGGRSRGGAVEKRTEGRRGARPRARGAGEGCQGCVTEAGGINTEAHDRSVTALGGVSVGDVSRRVGERQGGHPKEGMVEGRREGRNHTG